MPSSTLSIAGAAFTAEAQRTLRGRGDLSIETVSFETRI
jgi:hypothetical protein